jgi:hypothetical protein
MAIDEIRSRAKELMDIGNRIEDKIKQVQELEKEIESLQVYRNERGEQLLIRLIDSRNFVIKEIEK